MALPHPDQDSSAPLLLLQSVEHLALHFVGGLIQTLGPKYNKKHSNLRTLTPWLGIFFNVPKWKVLTYYVKPASYDTSNDQGWFCIFCRLLCNTESVLWVMVTLPDTCGNHRLKLNILYERLKYWFHNLGSEPNLLELQQDTIYQLTEAASLRNELANWRINYC